jgi:myo-inositol-1(or 4)-monophosphatase
MSKSRIDVAEEILRLAGAMIVRNLGQGRQTNPEQEKEAGHFVTRIDLTVDQLMIDLIRQQFPNDWIFTEESNFVGSESEYLWVIDPVDGTSNLRLGIPYVASSLAVLYAGETIFSAVYNPFLDEMIVGEKGSGAFLNGNRIQVSYAPTLSVGYYVQGYHVAPPIQLEILRVVLPVAKRILHTWAPTLDWCSIARGRAEFLIAYDTELEESIHGKLILEEAGGKVTTWDGQPVDLDITKRRQSTIIASNGVVHDHVCSLLKNVLSV